MARQWMTPEGFVIDEDGTDEYMLPVSFVINENQPAASPADILDAAQMLSPEPRWDNRMRFY